MIKIQKRIGVFETNSSSSHSISLDTRDINNLKCSLPVDNIDGEKVVTMECGEFGWGPEQFNDAYTKLSYLLTYIFTFDEYIDLDEKKLSRQIKNMDPTKYLDFFVKKQYINYKKYEYFKLLEEIIFDICNAKLIVKISRGFNHFGYIDHQSTHIAQKFLKRSKNEIMNFIFNPRSVLIIDHDNHL